MTQAWDFVNADTLWQTRPIILDKTIDDLELSVRSYNCLANMDVRTVGDLIKCTAWDLKRNPNFGAKSLREIRETLAMHNLKLAGE